MDLLAVSASASCFARPPLDTTPRFRLSCASERDSDTPRHTRPKSRSDSWQPRTDNSLTLFSFRLSQMSRISAPDSVSPVIWIEPGSILVLRLEVTVESTPSSGQVTEVRQLRYQKETPNAARNKKKISYIIQIHTETTGHWRKQETTCPVMKTINKPGGFALMPLAGLAHL